MINAKDCQNWLQDQRFYKVSEYEKTDLKGNFSGVNSPYIGITCYHETNMKYRDVTLLDTEATVKVNTHFWLVDAILYWSLIGWHIIKLIWLVKWGERDDVVSVINVAWAAVRRPTRMTTNSRIYCVQRNQSKRSDRCILVWRAWMEKMQILCKTMIFLHDAARQKWSAEFVFVISNIRMKLYDFSTYAEEYKEKSCLIVISPTFSAALWHRDSWDNNELELGPRNLLLLDKFLNPRKNVA